MPALDFYAHVAVCSEVLGVGLGADPEAWEAALGATCLDVPGGGLLRRDYGLVEINFSPDQPGLQGQMSCFGFGVKIQRLLYAQYLNAVPSPLSRQYGEFAPRVPFKELQAAILALGHTIALDRHNTSSDMDCYRVSASAARIHVVADPDPYGSGDPDPDGHHRGDVWSIDVW
ncbi:MULTISPECIES: hypothetical protein [unclassified Streptomyces]|uniref:hypothetical protein n=1 Tax=unclassified Streptomyces TaxID=2593676 RepID=UPI00093A4260|nr:MULTISPECIES: hypothetical protein [unclassified Streptomyces]OKK24326.1 hypothetical protein AMK09_05720 [Streptomyces sp. CB02488]WRZ12640.1 hypothetical protein OG892_18580 [Streptomyces sp. NBC_00341]WSJ23630.1 hypothetical protein OG384_17380 [Streptomyces sp. NBC_01324]